MFYVFFLCSLGLAICNIAVAVDSPPPGGPMAVDDLFMVDYTTNNVGGCKYWNADRMQMLLQDAYDLAEIGQQLVNDYGNDVAEARRLLDSFFMVTAPPLNNQQLASISEKYNEIQAWLMQGGPVNDGTNPQKPYIFCYSNWVQRYSMTDIAKDADGDDIPGEQIISFQKYRDLKSEMEGSLGLNKQNRQIRAYPYWSLKHLEYLFDQSYQGASLGYCDVNGHEAVTQHILSPSSITLCPVAFGTKTRAWTEENLATAKYVGRRATPANPIPMAGVPNCGLECQRLVDVAPTAVNFFHELFHLVLGNAKSKPPGGEIYDLVNTRSAQIVGLDFATALVNPESLALAAIGYDYTLNSAANGAGSRLEFFTGYTTQG